MVLRRDLPSLLRCANARVNAETLERVLTSVIEYEQRLDLPAWLTTGLAGSGQHVFGSRQVAALLVNMSSSSKEISLAFQKHSSGGRASYTSCPFAMFACNRDFGAASTVSAAEPSAVSAAGATLGGASERQRCSSEPG